MRQALLYLVTLLAMLLSMAGSAEMAFAGAQVVGAATSQLDVEIGKGRLIRLDSPAASVFIADPRIADVNVKSPTLVYVMGKEPGSTTLYAVNEHDAVLANMDINVHYDENQLKQDLRRLLPGTEIGISTANNALVLSGVVGSAADGESAKAIAARFAPDQDHIVNAMQVDAPNQVNLRVRVAEVSRDIIKQLGFNWGSSAGVGRNFLFGLGTGTGISTGSASGIAKSLTPGTTGFNALLPPTGGVDNLLASYASRQLDLNVLIDALDSEGLVNVLAEPNLTAVSGQPASFLAGGEFPIPVPQGLSSTTIQYKNFGVSLSMVATITDGGRINLVVKPEVSELSTEGEVELNGFTVPSLTTRRTETTVDLASGQSFAIAGLLQNNVTHTLQKFPGLGNLPVLGALFRSDKFERNETELVIIVTPYLVRPVSDHRLIAPTDGYIAPTDQARVMNGADYTPQSPGNATLTAMRSGHGLIGPIGFDLQ
jgi:pilus assembly protein CpaC